MREIKFRAWHKPERCMKYGNMGLFMFVGTGTLGWQCGGDWDIGVKDEFELMQYTGLKDKNGKEIYEGDIVKWWHNGVKYNMYGVIQWDKQNAGFEYHSEFKGKNGGSITCMLGSPANVTLVDNNIKVIGNIYENKELLESK